MLLSSGCSKKSYQEDAVKDEIETFDPSKCEIEGEHNHLHLENTFQLTDEGKKGILVWLWLSDESIKKKRENDPNFEVFNKIQYIIKKEASSEEEVYGNKVLLKDKKC